MKSIFQLFFTSLLVLCSLQNGWAQDDGYGGHWFIGLSGGAAWQDSDAKIIPGGGWSFYLGKNVYYRPKAPLSLDLRMRYLGTTTFGQDFEKTDISLDPVLNGSSGSLLDPNYSIANGGANFVYQNHKTNFHDLSLEARVNFENLRRKHRIWLSLYGGIGIGWYNVAYDQLDDRIAFDNEYFALYNNMDSLEGGLNEREIANQLIAGRDGSYETYSDGSLGGDYDAIFTPSLGFEFGYWITPRFAMGIGHRVNWTFRDDFDGVIRNGDNDVHHYANLFIHGIISGGSSNNNVKPVPDPVRVNPPQVQITAPSNSPYTHGSSTYIVRATIRNVESTSGVQFIVNGQNNTNFSFNPSVDAFVATVQLNPGANTVVVKGSNSAGSDQDAATIIYQSSIANNPKPPTVNITQPSANPYTSPSQTTIVRATIRNVANRSGVKFTLNGQNINNFNFSGTNFIATGVNLQQGSNTVVITGTNNDGTATDQTVIIYQPTRTPTPPTVNITQPSANPYNSPSQSTTIRAVITNVPNRNGVRFTLNGQNISNFTFNGTSFMATGVNLQQGANTVVVTGTNQDGTASDQVTINYQPQRNPPTVNITQPTANPYTSPSQTTTVRATIRNVASRNGITYTLNGQTLTNFNFSGTNFIATGVSLQQGNNTVVISASNNDGTATDQTVIIYKPRPIPKPPTVTITIPNSDPFQVTTSSTNIMATITNVPTRNGVRFTLNGQNITNFNFNGTSFVATGVNLQQGANTAVISGTNQDGTASDQVIINYQPQSNPPTVSITQPSADPYQSPGQTTTIRATIRNVANRSGVTFTLNGQNVSNFNFSGTNFIATGVNLQQGNNSVVITGTNSDGTASDQTVIIYKPRRVPTPPTVNITMPNSDPFQVTTSSTNIMATITNVPTRNGVRFTLNGQNITNFNFNGTSFVATGVNLQQGANTVVISGTNQDGTASDQVIINYQPQSNPPTVSITQPSADPYQSPSQTTVVRATIRNVANRSGVTFTLNGQNVSNFNFSGTNFIATGVSLQQGNNSIVITGTNNDGTASDQTVIIYKPRRVPTPPTVNITQPSANPAQVTTSSASIAATITNVPSRNGVSFKVNGQTINNFNYNGGSFSATAANLQAGNNTIVITGTNQDGTASDQTVIVYNEPAPEPCGPRFNPGNSQWEFCLITPSGTYNRDDLANNSNFSYSGPASSAYFKPIAGGGNAVVNGQSYPVQNGKYYLFQGNLTVDVSSKHPGSMGHWEICINSNATPVFGNGNNRPTSPCAAAPAPTVTITSPAQNPHTQNNNKVMIKATIKHVANANNVTFKVNGQNNRNFSLNGDNFMAPNVSLNSGSNTFVITGTNAQGTASDQTVVVYNAAPQPPEVTITSPSANPYNSPNQNVTIRANIKHVSSANDVVFVLNGQYLTNFNFSGQNFVANNVPMRNGTNTVSITVRNNAGTDTETTTINYNPVSAPDVYDMTVGVQPQGAGGCKVRVVAGIRNVSSRNQITFKVNGQVDNSFTFKQNTGVFEKVFTVNSNNPSTISYSITATNSAGTDTEAKTGNVGACGPRVSPPDVRNTQVSIARQGSRCMATVRSEITNVPNKNGVNFKVNGQTRSDFSFSNGILTANIDVSNVSANNISFVITGTNSAGTDAESKTASTSSCVAAPVISNMNASQQQVRGNFTATVTAKISNISNKSQITFKVNGVPYSNFSFSNGNFSATNVPVRPGKNTYQIVASNVAGSDTENKQLTVAGNTGGSQNGGNNSGGRTTNTVQKPTVTITSPRGSSTATSKVNVTATVKNVTQKSQVTVKVNGTNISNFSLRGSTVTASGVTLRAGNNTIQVSANNGKGSDSKTKTINFTAPSNGGKTRGGSR